MAETRQDFITLQPFIKPEPNIEAEKMNSPVVVVAAAVNVVKLFFAGNLDFTDPSTVCSSAWTCSKPPKPFHAKIYFKTDHF